MRVHVGAQLPRERYAKHAGAVSRAMVQSSLDERGCRVGVVRSIRRKRPNVSMLSGICKVRRDII